MKRSLLSLGLLLSATAFGWADLVMVQKLEGEGQNGEMTLKIKGDRARIDMGPQTSVLTNLETGELTTLMHGQKMYMVITPEMAQQFLKQAQQQGGEKPAAEVKLTPTGKKETINGSETEIYTLDTGNMKASYWIAKSYPNEAKVLAALKKLQNTPTARMAREMAPQPEEFPGVPLKTEVELKGGQKVTTTVLSLTDEEVDAKEFAPPAGYQPMATPQIPGGAGQ